MADIPLEGDIEVRLKGDDGTGTVRAPYVTSAHRLAVDAQLTETSRVTYPVFEADGWNNDTTKISYTVPSGKVLYIQHAWASHASDAVGHAVAFRTGTTQFCWMEFNNDGLTTFEKQYPTNNPYGPISAGTVITVLLIEGSTDENWSAGFDGYLEDA